MGGARYPHTRRPTRPVRVGPLILGGDAPVAVQAMTKTDTRDVRATVDQISRLVAAGAEIIRLAVPDREAALALAQIRAASPVPLVADIHFDHRLALMALEAGVDKLRINPGNIGGGDRMREVVTAAGQAGAAIRVGVNAGSLEAEIQDRLGRGPEALAESALRNAALLEDMGFEAIVLSVKASDVADTVNACLDLSARTDWPLHLGITEAGGPRAGVVKSSTGIGFLLALGVGDTLRVSLTADPDQEVQAAWEILRAWNIRRRGVNIVSCPTCGRCRSDLFSIARQVEEGLAGVTADLTVAVMGCPVNGPGEAAAADVGVAMGETGGVLFRRGQVTGRVDAGEVVGRLLEAVRAEIAARQVDSASPHGVE